MGKPNLRFRTSIFFALFAIEVSCVRSAPLIVGWGGYSAHDRLWVSGAPPAPTLAVPPLLVHEFVPQKVTQFENWIFTNTRDRVRISIKKCNISPDRNTNGFDSLKCKRSAFIYVYVWMYILHKEASLFPFCLIVMFSSIVRAISCTDMIFKYSYIYYTFPYFILFVLACFFSNGNNW